MKQFHCHVFVFILFHFVCLMCWLVSSQRPPRHQQHSMTVEMRRVLHSKRRLVVAAAVVRSVKQLEEWLMGRIWALEFTFVFIYLKTYCTVGELCCTRGRACLYAHFILACFFLVSFYSLQVLIDLCRPEFWFPGVCLHLVTRSYLVASMQFGMMHSKGSTLESSIIISCACSLFSCQYCISYW